MVKETAENIEGILESNPVRINTYDNYYDRKEKEHSQDWGLFLKASPMILVLALIGSLLMSENNEDVKGNILNSQGKIIGPAIIKSDGTIIANRQKNNPIPTP